MAPPIYVNSTLRRAAATDDLALGKPMIYPEPDTRFLLFDLLITYSLPIRHRIAPRDRLDEQRQLASEMTNSGARLDSFDSSLRAIWWIFSPDELSNLSTVLWRFLKALKDRAFLSPESGRPEQATDFIGRAGCDEYELWGTNGPASIHTFNTSTLRQVKER